MFRLPDLLARHRGHPADREITDDVRLYEEDGSLIAAVEGDERLMKLTTSEDFAILSSLIAGTGEFDMPRDPRQSTSGRATVSTSTGSVTATGRSASAVSKSRMTEASPRIPMVMSGFTRCATPSSARCPTVTSDRIFRHPTRNGRMPTAPSSLRFATERCAAHGAELLHLDLTLICEQPKIGPHRDAMRHRIAELAGLPPERVAVKATTSEKLGFTGRGEGIAAQATATILFERGRA